MWESAAIWRLSLCWYSNMNRDAGTQFFQLAPIDRLKFLMRESGMNVCDLGRVIGIQPNASLTLSDKRSLSKGQILKLARHFAVSPALFME